MESLSLLDNKLAISLVSALVGGVITRIFSVVRGRIQELDYTVEHDRVGLSVNDDLFGNVKAIWQGHELTNLYSSTVTVTNGTARDFKDVILKIYTGETLLLTERVEIQGTTYIPVQTDAYQALVRVEPGNEPTERQMWTYRHTREYGINALNRGQRAIFRYLTTQPTPNSSPGIWVDVQQEGLRARFKPMVPEIHGVPIKTAIQVGLFACICILTAVLYLPIQPDIAAPILLFSGLLAQSIGAWLYKWARIAIRFFAQ